MPRVWELPDHEPLFLTLTQGMDEGSDDVDLRICTAAGDPPTNDQSGLILWIDDEGVINLVDDLDPEVAKRAGLNLDENGRIRIRGVTY